MTGHETADAFTSAVREIIAAIPAGRVMAYGEVAAVLGSRAARRVGRILATDAEGLPWWRVVRADGLPPRGLAERALPHYTAERTPLEPAPAGAEAPYRVARAARWRPD